MMAMPEPGFITIPARIGKEAQLAHNDIWPGDPIDVSLSSLASEAARDALTALYGKLERDMLEAFRNGQDYVIGPLEQTRPTFGEAFAPRSLFEKVKYEVTVKAGAVEPGSFEQGELPHGWRLIRLADWQAAHA